jgi:hypothetical protein
MHRDYYPRSAGRCRPSRCPQRRGAIAVPQPATLPHEAALALTFLAGLLAVVIIAKHL